MTRQRLSTSLTIAATLVLSLAGLSSMRSSFFSMTAPTATIQYDPPPPPDVGEPDDRPEGGASRGCQPIALVPQTTAGAWGQTTVARPTFWVHLAIARPLDNRDRLAFVLHDETGKALYQTEFAASSTPPGIIKLTLPPTVAPLKVGQSYRWQFSIRCNAEAIEDRPGRVEGMIQRVELSPTIASQIAAAATPLEQAKLYAAHGIWYDTMTILGTELQTQSDPAIVSAWQSLLRQINLNSTVSVPLVDCCLLE